MAEPKRTKRTILQAKLESVVGTDPGSWSAANSMPIYDAFNVIQADIETIALNRARATLDPDGLMIGVPSYRIAGNVKVYNTGPDTGFTALTELPAWSALLRGAGFTPTLASAEYVYSPVSDTHGSLYFRAWLDNHLHQAAGARGNLVFSGEAGQPVECAFDYMGVYQKGTVGAGGVVDVSTAPGNPPRFCGLDSFRLIAENGDGNTFKPVIKSFSLDLGVSPAQRRDANAATCLKEFGIYQEYQPRLSVVIEVDDYATQLDDDTGRVNEFIEAMNQADMFAFELNVGDYTGTTGQCRRWTFTNSSDITYNDPADEGGMMEVGLIDTTTFGAQLARAPQYGDMDGIRTYELEFILTGTNNNFLKIIAR